MQLHIVGGFLGSGKTTGILTAASYLIENGKKVGVVTNDRGIHLVDTTLFKSKNILTVEIAQGCFRCNIDELAEKLSQLEIKEHPDVVFAESVGSCGDLVATVVKPLADLEKSKTPPTSYTVFTDSQLLLAYLQGIELPFSENVIYIFEKQIEEANILIINKVDLLSSDEINEIVKLAKQAYPEKVIKVQDSTKTEDVIHWIELLENDPKRLPQNSIDINYSKYGLGEMRLAWLDQQLKINTINLEVRVAIEKFIGRLQHQLRSKNIGIGHLKFFINTQDANIKISIPTVHDTNWAAEIGKLKGHHADILINARIEMPAEELSSLVKSALLKISEELDIQIEVINEVVFHPNFPKIPYRILNSEQDITTINITKNL